MIVHLLYCLKWASSSVWQQLSTDQTPDLLPDQFNWKCQELNLGPSTCETCGLPLRHSPSPMVCRTPKHVQSIFRVPDNLYKAYTYPPTFLH